jgi:hypothetical protein
MYCYLDAIYLKLRPDDEPAEGVLVAWGLTLEGQIMQQALEDEVTESLGRERYPVRFIMVVLARPSSHRTLTRTGPNHRGHATPTTRPSHPCHRPPGLQNRALPSRPTAHPMPNWRRSTSVVASWAAKVPSR